MKNKILPIIQEEVGQFLSEDFANGQLYGYHCTLCENIKSIEQTGLQFGKRSMQGNGIYAFFNIRDNTSGGAAFGYGNRNVSSKGFCIVKFKFKSYKRIIVFNKNRAVEIFGEQEADIIKQFDRVYFGFDNFLNLYINPHKHLVKWIDEKFGGVEGLKQYMRDKFNNDGENGQKTIMWNMFPSDFLERYPDATVFDGEYGETILVSHPDAIIVLGYYEVSRDKNDGRYIMSEFIEFNSQIGRIHQEINGNEKYEYFRELLPQIKNIEDLDYLKRRYDEKRSTVRNNREFDEYTNLIDLIDELLGLNENVLNELEKNLKELLNENLNESGKVITLYRGIGYNEGSNFYSPSKEFAMEFTRSGRESELRTFKANTDRIYRHDPLPRGYGREDPNFDLAIKTAQQQGYNAMWVDEGQGQPDSVFVINPKSPVNEEVLNEKTYKVYHGTNQQFSKFNFKNATQGIVWFTDSIDSIKNQEHGGMGNKIIMTRYITINKPAGWDEYEKYGLGQLQGMGYDGVILPQGNKTDYFVFSNKSISAKEPTNLNEVGEGNLTPYQYSINNNRSNYIICSFMTEDNDMYKVILAVVDTDERKGETWEISFRVEGINSNVATLNKGRIYRVMATLGKIMNDLIKEKSPFRIAIEPIKSRDEEENKRWKVYELFLSKNIPSGYRLKYSDEFIILEKTNSLNEDLNKKGIRAILDTDEAYEILDSTRANGSTWCAGACAVLAYALNIVYGYPIYVIYNRTDSQVEHFVVLTPKGTYIDCDGEQKQLLTNFRRKDFYLHPEKKLEIRPYTEDLNTNDIVFDMTASQKLAELIKNKGL